MKLKLNDYIINFIIFLGIIIILKISFFQDKQTTQSLRTYPKYISHYGINAFHFSNALVAIEQKTGKILFEYNPHTIIPPASMTKLVTLYIIYDLIHQKKLKETQLVPITTKAWSKMLPQDASRMFLEPIQIVSLKELMLGLAIPSANDAAIAIAELISGSVKQFVKLMNYTVHQLGLNSVHFVDANGYSNNNFITAHDFAQFCRIYLNRFPESIDELTSITEFVFPKKENFPKDFLGKRHPFIMKNHNPLLGKVDGVDGLKTGFISKSGFNVAVSIERSHTRIIIVSIGAFGISMKRVNQERIKEISMLADWLYSQY